MRRRWCWSMAPAQHFTWPAHHMTVCHAISRTMSAKWLCPDVRFWSDTTLVNVNAHRYIGNVVPERIYVGSLFRHSNVNTALLCKAPKLASTGFLFPPPPKIAHNNCTCQTCRPGHRSLQSPLWSVSTGHCFPATLKNNQQSMNKEITIIVHSRVKRPVTEHLCDFNLHFFFRYSLIKINISALYIIIIPCTY